MEKKPTYNELENKIKLQDLEISKLTKENNKYLFNDIFLNTIFNGISGGER